MTESQSVETFMMRIGNKSIYLQEIDIEDCIKRKMMAKEKA